MSQMSFDVLVCDQDVPNSATARLLRTIMPARVMYQASPSQPVYSHFSLWAAGSCCDAMTTICAALT